MASDVQDIPALKVDYRKSWSEILVAVTRHVLGPKVTFTTARNMDQIIITGYGCPIGIIRHGSDGIEIKLPPFSGIRGSQYEMSFLIGPQRYARPILEGDIVCLLEGSHHPSVFRLCGDHFDLVVPALFIASNITTRRNDSPIQTTFELSWSVFATCLVEFPRYVVFIWDWCPKRQSPVNEHHELLNSRLDHENKLNHFRHHSTAEVLEDIHDQQQLLKLINTCGSLPGPSQMPDLKKFAMICDHWHSYTCLKNYMSQLRWSIWLLSTPITDLWSIDVPIVRYWQAGGLVRWGLRSISEMIHSTFDALTGRSLAYETRHCVFDEQEVIPILHLLFPACDSLTTSFILKSGRTSVAPFGGRYLMQLVCYRASSKYSNAEGAVQFMLSLSEFTKPYDGALPLLFAILSETDAKQFELTPGMDHYIKQRDGTDLRAIWRFLLSEFAANAKVVFSILRDACMTANLEDASCPATNDEVDAEHDTWIQCLSVSIVALQHCVHTTNISELSVDDWDEGSADLMSVLQFVCETFNDPPLERPTDQDNVEDFIAEQSDWRYGDSLWERISTYSRDQRIHLARICLIGVLQTSFKAAEGHTSLSVPVDEVHIDRITTSTALMLLRGVKAADLSAEQRVIGERLLQLS